MLRILALETSGFSGSVAAADGPQVLGQTMLPTRQRTAQGLAPAIDQQLRAVDWAPRDVELIAVTRGPGSFTGLRVGIVTAKTMAYVTGAAVLGLDTLAVIARQAAADYQRLSVVMDAQRQQLFVESFVRDARGDWQIEQPTRILDNDAWLEQLAADTAVTGPGLVKLRERLPGGVACLSESCWEPTAVAVAGLAWREFQAGRRDDPWTLVPDYFRPSAAEEKFPVAPPAPPLQRP